MREKSPQISSLREPLVFKGRVLPELPSHYTEPSENNPLIVPYGAMPANPYLDEQVKRQQAAIESEFLKLHETPSKDMPESFVRVMTDDYMINEPRRKMINYEAHMQFIADGGYVATGSLADEMQRYEKGQASISEIADVIVKTPARKGEFGKVSHPYGYRMQYIDAMRTDTINAIESHNGIVYPEVSPYHSIKIHPKVERYDNGSKRGLQRIVGFIVRYKRDFGRIPVPNSDEDVHIVERQIAGYRVDQDSEFDLGVLAQMHHLSDMYPKRIQWDQPTFPNFVQRLGRTGCKDYIETAVQQDSLEDFVVPISTTIYGYKATRPVIGYIGDIALKPPVEDDGVAYYGPAHATTKLPFELDT
jgi:hypothetical protein